MASLQTTVRRALVTGVVGVAFTVVPAAASADFTLPAGDAATVENIGMGACNQLEWGYQLDGGSVFYEQSFPGGCGGRSYPNVTIGPFSTAHVLRLDLTDVTCGFTFDTNGPHAQVFVAGTNVWPISIADGGAFCQNGPSVNAAGSNFSAELSIAPAPAIITPTVTGTPGTGGWYTSNVSLQWGISGGGAILSETGCGSATITSDGVYTYSCSVTTTLGTVSDTVTIDRDATPPWLNASHAADGQNGWNVSSPVTETVTASDSVSGLAGAPNCTVDGNTASLTSGGTGSWTFPLSGDGTHAASCQASDNAGNSNTATDTVKIDTTPPSLNPAVSPSLIVQGGTATTSPNASDGGSGLASSSCAPVDTSTPGVHTVQCTATDNAGNTATASAQYTVYAPLSAAGASTCNGYMGGSGRSVTVPDGGNCTLVPGTRVSGSVRVGPGATLSCQGASIGQDLQVNQAAGVGISDCQIGHDVMIQQLTGDGPGTGGDSYICQSSIGHDLKVQNDVGGSAPLGIGDQPDCTGSNPGNAIGHDMQVQNNGDPVDVSNNEVTHDLHVQNNTDGTTVSDNSAGHDAQCQNNAPAATGNGNAAMAQNQGCPA